MLRTWLLDHVRLFVMLIPVKLKLNLLHHSSIDVKLLLDFCFGSEVIFKQHLLKCCF